MPASNRRHPDYPPERKFLQIAPLALDHVVGMEGDEEGSRRLVERLLQPGYASEHLVYSHQWEGGDLVLWDNRALMHSTTEYTYSDRRRSLYQVVLKHAAAPAKAPEAS